MKMPHPPTKLINTNFNLFHSVYFSSQKIAGLLVREKNSVSFLAKLIRGVGSATIFRDTTCLLQRIFKTAEPGGTCL